MNRDYLLPLPEETPVEYGKRTSVCVDCEDLERWRKYRGCVISVSDIQTVQRGYDDYGTHSYRTVVAWDSGTKQGVEFAVAPGDSINHPGFTLWLADAPKDVRDVHLDWVLNERNPQMATQIATRSNELEIAQIESTIATIQNPKPARGQTWVVVRGRKIAQGTSGTVFWAGDTGWGMKIGISPSGVRDSNNKYADAVFVALSNCRYIPDPATMQVVDQHQATIAQLQADLHKRIQHTLAEFNSVAIKAYHQQMAG